MELKEDSKPAPRVPLYMDIEYRRNYGRQNEQGRLKNISLSGAFLEVPHSEFLPDDKLVITLNVSGRERKLNASIIWKNENGCGIRFNPFNNRDVQIVDDLMYFIESKRQTRRSVLNSSPRERVQRLRSSTQQTEGSSCSMTKFVKSFASKTRKFASRLENSKRSSLNSAIG